MKKIDCNSTLNFIHECKRLCEVYEDKEPIYSCKGCPFDNKDYCPYGDITSVTVKDIDIVQKWSDAHPVFIPTALHKKYLEACKILGFNYIAKDSNNYVHIFETKPINTNINVNEFVWDTETLTQILPVNIDFTHLDDNVCYNIDELLKECEDY